MTKPDLLARATIVAISDLLDIHGDPTKLLLLLTLLPFQHLNA